MLALPVRKYYCLDLAFSPCVFLAYLIFFTATKYVCCSSIFVVVFLAVFLGRAVRFFLAFCCAYFARLAQKYIRWTLCNFCCINDVVFLVFWGLLVLLVFLLGIPPAYVFVCVDRVCVCVCACLDFVRITGISIICTSTVCLN